MFKNAPYFLFLIFHVLFFILYLVVLMQKIPFPVSDAIAAGNAFVGAYAYCCWYHRAIFF
jgi:hypothetical protein